MTHDAIFLREACRVAAAESTDPRTQNGAIIRARNGAVISAANQLPPIVVTPARLAHPEKYSYIEHAERHAVYRAARAGVATEGATLYCPWFACADCARAIILAGITKVVGHVTPRRLTPARWAETVTIADTMFREADVETVLLEDTLDARFLFNDEFLDL